MRPDNDLKVNIDAFEAQREVLEKYYMGKHALFHEGDFAGAFDTFHNAAKDAVRRFGNDTFLIRQVGAPNEMPIPASVDYRPVRPAAGCWAGSLHPAASTERPTGN